MIKQDIVMAICWIILGLTISIWSATFPFGSWVDVGPAFLPLACGLILVFLGIVLLFKARKENEGKPIEVIRPIFPRGAAFTRVALTLVGMLLSSVFLDFLGFVLTVFFLILFLMRAIEPQKWRVAILYALISTIGAYVLFQVLFKTTLPKGILGGLIEKWIP